MSTTNQRLSVKTTEAMFLHRLEAEFRIPPRIGQNKDLIVCNNICRGQLICYILILATIIKLLQLHDEGNKEMKMKNQIVFTAIVFAGAIATCCCLGILSVAIKKDEKVELPACPPLPKNFAESDLVGTWIGKYFGSIDKLIIQADGTYKQIYTDETLKFESDWQKWYLEYDSYGYLRLHLAGMRRCDGTDSVCNNLEGGLPNGEHALNPCVPGSLSFDHEVILFVTGSGSNVPRGIMLQQAKIGGSEWSYTFRLEELITP